MSADDAKYILYWLFKYAANVMPKQPPPSFSSAWDLAHLMPTTYKLKNNFQIKYRGSGPTFGSPPEVVVAEAAIGVTNEPIWGFETSGDAGPANGRQVITGATASLINDGNPDRRAVLAFDTLTAIVSGSYPGLFPTTPWKPTDSALLWNDIGSRIELGPAYGFGHRIYVQVYPTYNIWEPRAAVRRDGLAERDPSR